MPTSRLSGSEICDSKFFWWKANGGCNNGLRRVNYAGNWGSSMVCFCVEIAPAAVWG